MPGTGKSTFAKKCRAKRLKVCHRCARWTCNAKCCSLGMVSIRWCLDMLVLLRLKKKQCHICLANHEPQVICMWVPGKTTVQMQKVKSNYTLLFMRFSSLSSLIILQLLSRTTLTVLCPSFFNFPTVTKKNPTN